MGKRALRMTVMILGIAFWGGGMYLLALAGNLEKKVHDFPEYTQPSSERQYPLTVKGRNYFVSEADARMLKVIVPYGVPASLLLAVGCGVVFRRGRVDVLGQ